MDYFITYFRTFMLPENGHKHLNSETYKTVCLWSSLFIVK